MHARVCVSFCSKRGGTTLFFSLHLLASLNHVCIEWNNESLKPAEVSACVRRKMDKKEKSKRTLLTTAGSRFSVFPLEY